MSKAPKIISNLSVYLIIAAVLTLIFKSDKALAASAGCDWINNLTTLATSVFTIGPPSTLQPGEYIAVDVTPASGTSTTATLWIYDGTFRVVDTTTLPGTLTYLVSSAGVTGLMVTINGGSAVIDWSCGTPPPGSKTGPPAMNLFDGRINDHQGRDVAAPIAIYEGSINVYGIDPASGSGQLAVDISPEIIESVGIPADAPVLLGQGKNHYTGIDIFVYRLPTGEFQLNTHYHDGKPYIFAWDTEKNKWHFAW